MCRGKSPFFCKSLEGVSRHILNPASRAGTAYTAVFGGESRLAAFQPCLEQSSNYRHLESQWASPNADDYFRVELEEMVQSLRRLSTIMSGQDLNEYDKNPFSNEITAGQSRINRVLVDLGSHNPLFGLSIMRFSIHEAASLYTNLALRDIVAMAEMHHIMAKRLKAILEYGGSDIILTWGDNLEELIWTAFVGAAAATYWPERKFFVNILSQVRDSLLLSTSEQFRDNLKRFAWLDKFCMAHSRALWDEAGAHLGWNSRR